MTTRKKEMRDVALSDLQYRVMQALWMTENASASDVQRHLARDGRELALTTVATLLSRLAARGLAHSQREGRQVFYAAAVSEREIRRSMVSSLLGTLFAGDPRALMSHLVKESELDADDLEKLKTLLASSDNEDGKS